MPACAVLALSILPDFRLGRAMDGVRRDGCGRLPAADEFTGVRPVGKWRHAGDLERPLRHAARPFPVASAAIAYTAAMFSCCSHHGARGVWFAHSGVHHRGADWARQVWPPRDTYRSGGGGRLRCRLGLEPERRGCARDPALDVSGFEKRRQRARATVDLCRDAAIDQR